MCGQIYSNLWTHFWNGLTKQRCGISTIAAIKQVAFSAVICTESQSISGVVTNLFKQEFRRDFAESYTTHSSDNDMFRCQKWG